MEQGNKVTLYLDVDDTVLKSSEAVIEILNNKYNITPRKTINDMHDWEYKSIYKFVTCDEVVDIYESDEFFSMVKFDEAFIKFYKKHHNKFNFVFVTKGTQTNLEKKENLIRKVIGDNFEFIGVPFRYDIDGNRVPDYKKAQISMKYGIQVDDRVDALEKTGANIKILINHGRIRQWNKHYSNINNLYVVMDWNEIAQIALFAYENHFIFKK